MKTLVEQKFSEYFEKWVCELEECFHFIPQLSPKDDHSNDIDHEALVAKLTTHHKNYYTAKWAAAHEDVLAFFKPVWLTPTEISYLWVTGWKPSMAFRVVDSLRLTRSPGSSLSEFTDQQLTKIEELRVKVRVDEERVEREMERQQVSLADRRIVELAGLASRVRNGDSALTRLDGFVEVALKTMLAGLERVMKMADCVRLKTLKGVLELLNPQQGVTFLAATSMVLIQMRKVGIKKRDQSAA